MDIYREEEMTVQTLALIQVDSFYHRFIGLGVGKK